MRGPADHPAGIGEMVGEGFCMAGWMQDQEETLGQGRVQGSEV